MGDVPPLPQDAQAEQALHPNYLGLNRRSNWARGWGFAWAFGAWHSVRGFDEARAVHFAEVATALVA